MSGILKVFVLGAVLVQIGSGILWNRPEYDSPEESQYFPFLEEIAENLEYVVIQLLGPGDVWAFEDKIIDIMQATNLSSNASSGCRGCAQTTGLLLEEVKNGTTFEDVRDRVMEICFNLSRVRDMEADVICGAVDIFGPYLVDALYRTTMSAEDICLKMNSCQPEDMDTDTYVSQLGPAPPRPHGPKPYRRNVTLDETIKILHITDVHMEPYYDTGAATECGVVFCCRDEWLGTGYAVPWGDYNCNTPIRTLESFLEMFQGHNINYTMYTGDSPSNAVWEETLDHQLNMSKVVADRLQTYLPGVPAYMCLGNHDMYPTNIYFTPNNETKAVHDMLATAWKDVSGFTQEQVDTINIGGFYTQLLRPGLRVLSYNSNFAATDNWYIILDQDNNGYNAMKDFMETTFNNARDNGERIILLGHHPSGNGGMVREYSDFITDICRRNADLIALHLSGHSHSDSFQLNTDPDTGDVYDVQYSGPSLNSQTDINPTAKIFYLHPDTFDALEMDTFYLDLLDPLNNGSDTSTPNIVMSFRGTEEYGMVDMTPESFKDLVDRMEVDDALFYKYRYNRETRSELPGVCGQDCTYREMCNMRTTSYTQEQACLDAQTAFNVY